MIPENYWIIYSKTKSSPRIQLLSSDIVMVLNHLWVGECYVYRRRGKVKKTVGLGK